MNNHPARPAAVVAAILLVGIAAAGCGHRNESTAGPSPTLPTLVVSAPAATDTGQTATATSTDVAGSASPAPATPTPAGPPTPDPVASELDQINSLINDINNSISNSDSSQQGGE